MTSSPTLETKDCMTSAERLYRPRPGFEPGSLDAESSTLTIRLPRLQMGTQKFPSKLRQNTFLGKGRTIRKVMGGGGVGEKPKKKSCKGNCQEKKFVQRRR